MFHNRNVKYHLCVSLLLIVPVMVFAGAPPTPGAVKETLPKQKRLPPEAMPEEIESPQPVLPKVPAGGPKIPVKQFEITGNSALPTDELLGVIEIYKGRELTLLEIYAVADILTRYYRDKGFPLATVTVPPQQVSSGVIRFEVIEGRIGALLFEGNESYSSEFLMRHVDELVIGEIIALRHLEREVFSLNDLPGLHTRAIIKSGETFGTSDIVFRSVEKRFDAAMRFNNYGRESVGEWRVEGDLSFNNPFHIGDQFTVNLLHAEGGELDSLQFSYNLPLNVKGTRLNLLASRYHYYVDPEEINRIFAGSSLKGRGDYYNAEITHPLLRNRRTSVLIGAGVSRTLTRQSGSELLTPTAFNKRGDITLLNLLGSWSYLHADKQSLSNITAQFSTNFRTNNGVNRTTAEPDENAQKAKLQIDAAHLRRLPHDWTLYLKATGVYSVNPLFDTEKFRIGGISSVRAFPSGELDGDQGAFVSLELQHALPVPDFLGGQFRVFWDGGIVHDRQVLVGEETTASVTGIGGGITLELGRNYRFDLELVAPTTARSASDNQNKLRAWAGLSAYY